MSSLLGTATLPDNYWESLSVVTLLVRVIVGATFAAHGYKHFFLGGKVAGTARWFDSLGMKPNGMIHAVLASTTELVCGFMMIFGFLTPLAAAGYVGVLIVAAWTNHRPHGYWSDAGWEYVSILGTFAVFLAAVGPGKFSLDWSLGLDFTFHPYRAFAISVGLGVISGVGLLLACYRPPAPAGSDA